jgi:serine/threonine protein kinase/tetratricopeptide (TPR) repeat protein
LPGSSPKSDGGSLPTLAESFVGTERFLVQRRVGAGAFGVVYEAFDRHERATVALKVLRFGEADSLYRFKKGFRSLADLRHPNLIELYELHNHSGYWFFSMEMIAGQDFHEALWRGGERPSFDRVRLVILQLARGLHAVHESGRLHRDIKPPNVLVTLDDRVKLLDFGLVAELEVGRRPAGVSVQMIGTPAYMAPELANGDPGSPAADWYSVGVMLYQALAGELPFGGSLVQILSSKQRGRPKQELRRLLPEVPEDLEELCQRLLHPLPESRPAGEEVLEILEQQLLPRTPFEAEPTEIFTLTDAQLAELGRPPETGDGTGAAGTGTSAIQLAGGTSAVALGLFSSTTLGSSRSSAARRRNLRRQEGSGPNADRSPFVGRRDLVGSLAEAFDDSQAGPVLAYLKGPSGIGKSALLRHFLALVEERDERAVALYGRCYLQESVPYKALDSLIDALARLLSTFGDEEVEALLPAQLSALARLFPVLLRVGAVASAVRTASAGAEISPQVLRKRAVSALRELLIGLGRRHTLILAIDDLQWGDPDSMMLLDELFKSKPLPPLLFIGTYRSEDEGTSPFLKAMARLKGKLPERGIGLYELAVDKLSADDSRELIEVLLEEEQLAPERIESLLRDAAGSPLYLWELARWAVGEHPAALLPGFEHPAAEPGPTEVRLRDLILARIGLLGPAARRLLEVVSVAGKPIELGIAREAAALAAESLAVMAELRTHRLLRSSAVGGREEVETYHDRVREAVVQSLSRAALAERHRQLALALESSGRGDPETIAIHFQATAEEEKARRYVVTAAERAETTLAFERAARLYRLALDLLPPASDERSALQMHLARALGNAGRSRDAADTYLKAVGESGVGDPFEMQRQAAEKLLISGHYDRGLAILRHILRTVGLEIDGDNWRSLLRLWLLRLRLRFRGVDFKPRAESEIPAEVLRKIDVCWTTEVGLCLVDVLRAAEFHARHLLLALDAGEPQRIARGLAMEVFFGAMEGLDGAEALEVAREMAGRVEGHYAASLTEMAAGMVACSRGEWRRAQRRLARAEDQLRENRVGVAWELDTVRQFGALAALHLGRWQELFTDLPRLLELARQQGDVYLEVHLHQWVESLRDLVEDRPEEAQQALDRTAGGWSRQGFHYQHFGRLMAETRVALYTGDGQLAWDLLEQAWPDLVRSMIQRIEMVLVQSWDLRGRCALAAAVAARGPARKRLLAEAEKAVRRIGAARSSWAQALQEALSAGISLERGNREGARRHLEASEPAFAASEMSLHLGVVRLRLAKLTGQGYELADAELRDLGLVRPEGMAAILVPGSW